MLGSWNDSFLGNHILLGGLGGGSREGVESSRRLLVGILIIEVDRAGNTIVNGWLGFKG